jgi:hypothetical protein
MGDVGALVARITLFRLYACIPVRPSSGTATMPPLLSLIA